MNLPYRRRPSFEQVKKNLDLVSHSKDTFSLYSCTLSYVITGQNTQYIMRKCIILFCEMPPC